VATFDDIKTPFQSVFAVNYNDKPQIDNLRISYDYKIKYIKLYPWNGAAPVDLTDIRIQVNIFEDLFTNFLVGDISIIDTWDLPMLYPIIGEEVLEIAFFRPGTKESEGDKSNIAPHLKVGQHVDPNKPFKMKFRVIKMTQRQPSLERQQQYVLHFVSKQYVINKTTKVRRAYKDVLYSDMVQDILKKYLKAKKELHLEETEFKQHFIVPNYTPAQALNVIASRSKPAEHKGSSYVFYETLKQFHFVTLEKLYEQPSIETLIYQYTNKFIDNYDRRIADEIRNVEEYEFDGSPDVITNLVQGMYGSRLMTYDLVRRRYFEYDYDYLKKFKETKHLEDNEICTEGLDVLNKPMARFDLVGTNRDHDIIPWIASKEPNIRPTKIEKTLQHRHSQFQQIQNIKITLTVPGSCDRKVGDIISFLMPNQMSDVEKFGKKFERYVSGKYLITAIRHRIELNGYFQDIEIVKDSFWKQITYIDPVPIYKDTY